MLSAFRVILSPSHAILIPSFVMLSADSRRRLSVISKTERRIETPHLSRPG
jgi:hypothetical protein